MDTIEKLENDLRRIKDHNEKQLDFIRARISERQARGQGHTDLNVDLSQAKRTAEIGEALLEKRLLEARTVEAEKQEAQKSREAQARAAIEEKQKKAALTAWVKNGGDASKFNEAWEVIRVDLLTQNVIEEMKSQINPKEKNPFGFTTL